LGNSYKLEQERQFLELASGEASDKDFNTEVACLRTDANLRFIMGKPEEGRIEFQKALGIFSRYPGFDDYTQKTTHIYTEIAWAYAEASTHSLSFIEQHLQNAENLANSIPASPGTDQSRAQISLARARLIGGRNGGSPNDVGSPPRH